MIISEYSWHSLQAMLLLYLSFSSLWGGLSSIPSIHRTAVSRHREMKWAAQFLHSLSRQIQSEARGRNKKLVLLMNGFCTGTGRTEVSQIWWEGGEEQEVTDTFWWVKSNLKNVGTGCSGMADFLKEMFLLAAGQGRIQCTSELSTTNKPIKLTSHFPLVQTMSIQP